MTDSDSKEIQVKQKQEVAGPAEPTRPGIIFTPDVDIFETEKEITLIADIPGVRSDDLEIDLRDDIITISAKATPTCNDNECMLLTEYETGTYYRQFTLSEVINQEKIDAKLSDGVLRLILPKVEKATPRKIAVNVS